MANGDFGKIQNIAVARDSLSSAGNSSHHPVSGVNDSQSVQISVLGYEINVVSAGSGGRLHYQDSNGGSNLWTIPTDQTGVHEMQVPPEAIETSHGTPLGIELESATATVVISTVVGESY